MSWAKDDLDTAYARKRRQAQRRRQARRDLAVEEARWRRFERARTGSWPKSWLNEDHLQVAREHGVSADVASAAGLLSLETGEHRRNLADPVSKYAPLPALGLPVADFGHPVVNYWVLRPDKPRISGGDPVKYDHPSDVRNAL
jgi:hypothetical protein